MPVVAPPEKAALKGSGSRDFALNFAVGAIATVIGVSIIRKITGGGSNNPPTPSSTTSTSSTNQYLSGYSSGPNSQYQSIFPQDSTSTSQSGQPPSGQYQNQQRAVDDSKRVDIFGEPHSSHGPINDFADGVVTTAGSSESKS